MTGNPSIGTAVLLLKPRWKCVFEIDVSFLNGDICGKLSLLQQPRFVTKFETYHFVNQVQEKKK